MHNYKSNNVYDDMLDRIGVHAYPICFDVQYVYMYRPHDNLLVWNALTGASLPISIVF